MNEKKKGNLISASHYLSCPPEIPPHSLLSPLTWSTCINFLSPWVWNLGYPWDATFWWLFRNNRTTEREEGRKRERFCEYHHLREQISHDNTLLVPDCFGVGLFIGNANRQMGHHKNECGILHIYKQACICSGCESIHFLPTHYNVICPGKLSFH